MRALLEDIFVADGPGAAAPQVKMDWDVYDLWETRMKEATAQRILDAPENQREKLFIEANWYNSTEMSYKDGLAKNDERVMGKKIGVVEADGEMVVTVPKHAAKMFRLRSQSGRAKRYSVHRDEL